MNIGKLFEQQLKISTPSYSLLYRLPDAAQSFSNSNNLRFSSKNPFDFLLWDSKGHILYAIEAKTVSKKSISFERDKGDKKVIHLHQIKGLNEWNKYDGIICGFIIEFRELEKTIFLEISEFNKLISVTPKKSFTIDDLENNNIAYFVINQKKARTRYRYDIDTFLSDVRKWFNQKNKKIGG